MVDGTDRRAHPYQAHSRDAFKLVEHEMRGQRQGDSDRGCPLRTGLARPMWHASGTAGEDEPGSGLAAMVTNSGDGRGPSPDDYVARWQARGARQPNSCGRVSWYMEVKPRMVTPFSPCVSQLPESYRSTVQGSGLVPRSSV
jgi:hypothetical protein